MGPRLRVLGIGRQTGARQPRCAGRVSSGRSPHRWWHR